MVVAILNGFQMRQVGTEKVPPTVHACGICQRLDGNWILVEWWKIAQKPNLAFAVDAILVIVWVFFLHSKQPAKPKTSGQIFWGISKVIVWIWRGCRLMKGQTNTLWKTILMELTKEEIEEKVPDLCMNCWQMAKKHTKKQGGVCRGSTRKGDWEQPFVYEAAWVKRLSCLHFFKCSAWWLSVNSNLSKQQVFH